ncbi:MAG: sigma-70 family RNA polymerase sigma factor [Chthonomonadales bacterium]|nr:sigma-70 family RNA polymerase sigma factor [Chthonomonadales bacterium]
MTHINKGPKSMNITPTIGQDTHTVYRNDHAEFETYISRTKRQAYNLAYRMTGNREQAEDLAQEAYLRAYRSFDRYNRSMPFENWLFRILTNLFVDSLRRRPKQQPLSLDRSISNANGDEGFAFEIADHDSDPERIVLRDVMDERLQEGLAALPKHFKTAVLLCDVEGMSYEEIARTMETSVGTVRSRIHRGRRMLRKYMEQGPPVHSLRPKLGTAAV